MFETGTTDPEAGTDTPFVKTGMAAVVEALGTCERALSGIGEDERKLVLETLQKGFAKVKGDGDKAAGPGTKATKAPR